MKDESLKIINHLFVWKRWKMKDLLVFILNDLEGLQYKLELEIKDERWRSKDNQSSFVLKKIITWESF
jgi:hypothetical protein